MNIKNLLNRPFFVIVNKLRRLFGEIENKLDKREFDQIALTKEERWNALFGGKDFFEFQLSDKLKINLYRDSVLSKIIYQGFEKDEIHFLEKSLKEGDVFLDIGTNIGLFSLFASNLVGETGKVISFEPAPSTFLRLVENIKLNGLKNIEFRNIGLSDSKSELRFYISKNGHDAWNSFAPSADNKLEDSVIVPVNTLDSELEIVDKQKIKLVKIDVEGWEKFVLKGGEDFFTRYSPIVMMEFTEENTFNAGYSVHQLYEIMIEYGYKWYSLSDGELVAHQRKISYPYDNLVAVKNN